MLPVLIVTVKSCNVCVLSKKYSSNPLNNLQFDNYAAILFTRKWAGAIFTTIFFLCNLQMGPIS
jgi:hypothetical protein